jgi:hypothetical protein
MGGPQKHFLKSYRMGFIREQQKRLAIRFLSWQYEKKNVPMPSRVELERHASGIVEDAHRIARKRGRNVMSIIKEMIADLKP